MSAAAEAIVPLGEIAGVHGVRGWVKVHSFTEPRTNLADYPRWWLEHEQRRLEVDVLDMKESGKRLIAKFAGFDDRDAAEAWIGAAIGVPRSALPELGQNEYYWTDLVGLAVVDRSGKRLGEVDRLIETGANDVLVLDGPGTRMIPFALGKTIRRVDLAAGEIVVDWDESYWD